ncbi:MAG: CRISPR-associated endonuclease Cas6 [Candidatus Cloacimonetes bacterium]|jgi:hypothetical protein|nr:CRISPR-associated endonuclease Cas6 [Candidatus Cloacimonadota bacterium]
MIEVEIMSVKFADIGIQARDIPKIRGYFATKYREHKVFHNHQEDGSFSYSFPKIHFKSVNKQPLIIGINEGIKLLQEIVFNEEEINIDGKIYQLNEKTITKKTHPFGVSDTVLSYRFISPWMALNEENYKAYMTINDYDKWFFLNRLLRENFKTLAKGFNYFIPDVENVEVEGKYYPKQVNFKNQKMLCFTGWFNTNFHIPDYLGVGKQSARGFGTIVQNERRKNDPKVI